MSARDPRSPINQRRDAQRMSEYGLDEALDGELCAETIARLEKHLEGCTECAEEMARLRALKALLQRTMPVPAPSGLRERISVQCRTVTHTDDAGTTTLSRTTVRRELR